jgi:hypothetical protein
MSKIVVFLFFLASCSLGINKTGGDKAYTYDVNRDYQSHDLELLAPQVVSTSFRNPPLGTIDQLFGKGQPSLKKIGIIVFETQIQPTRGGLADYDKVYLSAQGKQLLTEKLHHIWNESFSTLDLGIDYVSAAKIKKSKSLHNFGADVTDYVKAKRNSIESDDIFYVAKGKKTTTATVLNPRGMQDLSFLLVPATELMHGPKWSEHNKQFLNEMIKEHKLDAALIVMSDIHWTAERIDKNTKEFIPEAMTINITASTLISLSQYRQRAEKIGLKNAPSISVCYRHYESSLNLPVNLSPIDDNKFAHIEKEVLSPMLKAYKDLSLMMIHSITQDLKKTF